MLVPGTAAVHWNLRRAGVAERVVTVAAMAKGVPHFFSKILSLEFWKRRFTAA
jgi:hypothetical protein